MVQLQAQFDIGLVHPQCNPRQDRRVDHQDNHGLGRVDIQSRDTQVHGPGQEVGNQENCEASTIEGMQDPAGRKGRALALVLFTGRPVNSREEHGFNEAEEQELRAIKGRNPQHIRHISQSARHHKIGAIAKSMGGIEEKQGRPEGHLQS